MHQQNNNWTEKTLAVRGGQNRSSFNEHSEAIFMTSSFVFKNAEEAKELFENEKKGFVYSRFSNPTVDTLANRIALLEGAKYGLVTASGMSAIMTCCLGLLKSSDNIVCSMNIFGTSVGLFRDVISRFNIKITFVALTDYDGWENAINKDTTFVFCESPSNPILECVDFEKLANLCYRFKTLLIVDNCIATPALQQPLKHGADIVMHSMTKFIDGGGRCLGGSIVTNSKDTHDKLFSIIRSTGPSLSPFNAWILLKSLETLNLRMFEHSRNAEIIADWISQQPNIIKVYYPTMSDYPYKHLMKKQMKSNGALLSFEVKGGREEAWKIIDSCKLFSITANLGDSRSSICHPSSTTHNKLDDTMKKKSGISEGLIRISVGLEDTNDLCQDLKL